MKNAKAIVLAAGQGKRMGSAVPKQFLELDGKPLLYYSLECFEQSDLISEIILVTGKDAIPFCWRMVEKYGFQKVKYVVPGGKERYDSVYEGLKACEDCDIVFIHDGARPFPDGKMLERTMEAADKYGACVAAVPTKDTMKVGNAEGIVERTLDRKTLWNVQTPQVFRYDLICQAHREIRKGSMEGVTDDSMIVETLGICPVKLVMGSYDNIKVTTPEDLVIAENILNRRAAGQKA